MKFYIFILISVLIILMVDCRESTNPLKNVNHQNGYWEQVRASQDENSYHAIFFSDATTGWVVGDSGRVLFSVDGGNTWMYHDLETDKALWNIQFVTPATGWIVGKNNTILKTENGGKVWRKLSVKNNYTATFLSLSFINENSGWIADNMGNIFRTIDSGISWIKQESDTQWAITALQFINEKDGWAITTNKIALFTTDGGITWNQVPVPSISDNISVVCNNIFFIDKDHGWICGMYAGSIMTESVPLYYTKSSGLKWETQAIIPAYVVNSVYFINSDVGWAAAERKIFNSVDGGYTWQLQHETETGILIDIHFADATHGWALDWNGNVYKYERK